MDRQPQRCYVGHPTRTGPLEFSRLGRFAVQVRSTRIDHRSTRQRNLRRAASAQAPSRDGADNHSQESNMIKQAVVTQSSNFNLKNEYIDLVGAPRAERATMTIQDLETMRAQRKAIPASKHGLETICGASCETGAQ
jgi:hypothetical protein